eukprot:Lithocolla_globosa_v1_NODE_242_length_4902_cov_29.482773.p6 type:complete len:138 gc:universal NODE_242_length_4902_cov_29.482773:519-106(-)
MDFLPHYKMKTKPILSVTKSGVRYIQYRGKRYRLVSDETDDEVVRNLRRIAEILEKKQKRKRRQQKITKGTNAPTPILKASSSTMTKSDSERLARLQLIEKEFKLRNDLQTSSKTPIPAPAVTITNNIPPALLVLTF